MASPELLRKLENLTRINLFNYPMFMSLFAYPLTDLGMGLLPPGLEITVEEEVKDGWYNLVTGVFQDASRNGAVYVYCIADDDIWTEVAWYVTGSMMSTPLTFSPPLLVTEKLVVTFKNTADIPVMYSNMMFGYAIREEYFKDILKQFEEHLGFKVPTARRRKIK